jgi:predicted NBD/HSP70 family sugar kinase
MPGRERERKTSTAARILRSIWKHPNSSRIAIAERLGLDKSTITNQVNALLDLGIIEEIEEGESSAKGGRKPISLGIRKTYGRILGIEIQSRAWRAVELDLAGNILSERRGIAEVSPDNFADLAACISAESAAATGTIEGTGGRLGPLLGIGIGTGGLIDQKHSRIRYSVPLDIYEPVELGPDFATKIPFPCFIENDANCCAWGELAFDRENEARNFLFALVEYRRDPDALREYGGIGIGFGIVLGGKVFPGSHGNAGEFRSAFCDGRGEVQFSIGKERLALLSQDQTALEQVSDELARNMALLVNTMDFERVYIGGDIEELGVDFPAILHRRLEENWMYPFPKDTSIRYSSMGGKAVAYGAAGLILDKLVSESLLPGI